MNISIIIPNYNGKNLLIKNLPSVFSAVNYFADKKNEKAEIIIVDDASTDGSTSVVIDFKSQFASKGTDLSYIQNEQNLGFSSTVNKGVKEAKGEIIVLLNSDVSPTKDFLVPLISHFKDKKVFAVGAMDKSIEAGREVLRGRGIGRWERGFLVHAAGKLDKETSLWASGGSSAFKKEIWDELGGLDELFNPFYWEDIDISYRSLKSGYTILFEKESIVVHEHEKGAIKTKYKKNEILKIAYRNQFLFVWKNADSRQLFFHILWLPYHLLKAVLRIDIAFYIAFFNALGLFQEILKKREKIHKKFIFTDDAIISEYKT